jgi:hypothetical protein
MKQFGLCLAGLLLSLSAAVGAENSLMHCFAFTPIESASQSEWDAFYKTTDALPGKIPGLKRVWYGKLARPLNWTNLGGDPENRKKIMAEGKGTSDVTFTRRQHGVCMEFESQKAFEAYGPHAAHKEWEGVYSKVRQPGTTTFQILPVQ